MNESVTDGSPDEKEVRSTAREARISAPSITSRKSSDRYQSVYTTYKQWLEDNKDLVTDSHEENLMVYFRTLKEKLKPSTLWSVWSMLRKTLNAHDNVDITNFADLKTLIKKNAVGHTPNRSFGLTWNQIMKFMMQAPDETYLATKVVLVFGICGALGCDEITNIRVEDVEDLGEKILVTVECPKKNNPNQFIIGNLFYKTVKKYILLRPTDEVSNRFFVQYHNGKCNRQPIGRHKIGEMPENIASYLNLESSAKYTGHCFRRTASLLLSESGANLQTIRQLGRFSSEFMSDGCAENSAHNIQLIYDGNLETAETTTNIDSISSSSTEENNGQREAESNCEMTEFSEEKYTINNLKAFVSVPLRRNTENKRRRMNLIVIQSETDCF